MTHTWRSSTSTLWEVLYRYDSAADIARLAPALPVTLAHDDRDQSAPIANVRALAALHTAWQLVVSPGVDHNPLLRSPAAVCEAMAGAIAQGRLRRSREVAAFARRPSLVRMPPGATAVSPDPSAG